ncbi:Bug family tripartite tricarboxylate transporter substrate binding protein [Ramlibacter sp.]|uniref:Bug family tripartite tricarboxylate transporter substrate binding protein n=1 Tax=Ramlibacter sp. TaxID=1917967 RepID=UPI003D0B7F8E
MDLWVRVLAPLLEARWKQSVVVENRPGASGLIGTEYVARAPADGHTILAGSQTTAMAKLTSSAIKFDPQVDLAPVYKFINYKIVFATNAQTAAQARTLVDLVALSQAKGGLFFGGLGASSSINVSNAIVNRALGMKFTSVDFPGTAQAMLALLRNDVQLVLNTPGALKPFIDAGTVAQVAVLSEARFSDMPDVQSVREAGYRGYVPQIWNGLFAPRNTPLAIRQQIARDIQAVATTAEGRALFDKFTGVVQVSAPESFEKEMTEETRVWREFLASINFKPE